MYQITIKLPSGHKIYQMAVIYSKWPLNTLTFPFKGPPKFTQIGIFGLKIRTSWQPWNFAIFCLHGTEYIFTSFCLLFSSLKEIKRINIAPGPNYVHAHVLIILFCTNKRATSM
jgi:hypothetical protein